MPANQYPFLTEWHFKAPRELLHEIFQWNHGWAMARGFENLCREAARLLSDEKVTSTQSAG